MKEQKAALQQQPEPVAPSAAFDAWVQSVSPNAWKAELDLAHQAWITGRAALVAELEQAEAAPPALQQQEEPREALSVWFGPMLESSGKTNWTAILHRGDTARGITIERSEHHDRVRYEADRMRHMIGELAEEPDILAYDADMLSPSPTEKRTEVGKEAQKVYHACEKHMGLPFTFKAVVAPAFVKVCPHCEAADSIVAELVAGLRRAEEKRKQRLSDLPEGTCETCMGEGYLGSIESQRITDCPDCIGGVRTDAASPQIDPPNPTP